MLIRARSKTTQETEYSSTIWTGGGKKTLRWRKTASTARAERTRSVSLTWTSSGIYRFLRTCRWYLPYGDRKLDSGWLISSSEPFHSVEASLLLSRGGFGTHANAYFFFFFFLLAAFYWKRQGGRGLTWLPQKCTWGGAFTALTCMVKCCVFKMKTWFICIIFLSFLIPLI